MSFTPIPPEENETGNCGSLQCPENSMDLGNGECVVKSSTSVTPSSTIYTVQATLPSSAWGWSGTRFYEDADTYLTLDGLGNIIPLRAQTPTIPPSQPGFGQGFLENNDGNTGALELPHIHVNTCGIWKACNPPNGPGVELSGRLNLAGVWSDQYGNASIPYLPTGEWIGFSACIEVPTTKKYCIGIAGDNRIRFRLDGQIIARFDRSDFDSHNWRFLHVIEITLQEGVHTIEIEGYNEADSITPGGFVGEVYNATVQELIALTDPSELTQDILVFSTAERIAQVFDIGEESGYTCPDGSFYDNCTGGGICSQLVEVPQEVIECCYRMVNCQDSNDTYLVKFSETETNDLYQNYVFELGGHITFFEGKCFINQGLEICSQADVENVTVVVDHGLNNCEVCDPPPEPVITKKVESCDNPGTFAYLLMEVSQPPLVQGNIYEFTELEGCYSYIEDAVDITPTNTDVIIVTDYQSQECLICVPCQQFTNCKTQEELILLMEDYQNAVLPEISTIVSLSSSDNNFPDDACYQYNGSIPCAGLNIDYTEVVITEETLCTDCESCNDHYLLRDCTNASNTMEITWSQTEEPIDITQTYIFDFDPLTCWSVEYLPPLTEDCLSDVNLINSSNISQSYESCEKCNEICYRVRDCETQQIIGYFDLSTSLTIGIATELAGYLGKVIKWRYLNDFESEGTCASIESYVCRTESYFPFIDVENPPFVMDCYKTCESCGYAVPEPEAEELKTGRKQKPGYNVPGCSTCENC